MLAWKVLHKTWYVKVLYESCWLSMLEMWWWHELLKKKKPEKYRFEVEILKKILFASGYTVIIRLFVAKNFQLVQPTLKSHMERKWK